MVCQRLFWGDRHGAIRGGERSDSASFVVILRAGTISLPATSWLVGSELTYRKRSLRLARLAWKKSLRQCRTDGRTAELFDCWSLRTVREALRQLAIANKRVVTTKPYRNGGIVNHLNLYHRER
jgi:hypothetical protein